MAPSLSGKEAAVNLVGLALKRLGWSISRPIASSVAWDLVATKGGLVVYVVVKAVSELVFNEALENPSRFVENELSSLRVATLPHNHNVVIALVSRSRVLFLDARKGGVWGFTHTGWLRRRPT